MGKGKYVRSISLPCYMFDANSRMRPSAFMDLTQDAATLGSVRSGFSDRELLPHGLVWIVVRMKVVFHDFPTRMDRISLETWHKGLSSVFFLRDYRMKAEDGTVLADSTSSWVIMDVEARRAVRSTGLRDLIPFESEDPDSAIDEVLGKIVLPENSAPVRIAEHRVEYSDVDYNRHANNAQYTRWAFDCLPDDVQYKCRLKEMEINFNRELHPGEIVGLYHCCTATTHYVQGIAGGEQIFIERFVF